MKRMILLLVLVASGCLLFGQDNPLKVESYQLANGLTIYLNEDHNMPMVHGMVAVKGGAKRDPKDATGIAHYFEHIMFKGTDRIGTVNYQEEKSYLDSIEMLYDELAGLNTEEEQTRVQKEINRISLKAAEYAIPNELAKIVIGMGGTGLNGRTNMERIIYYNSFPSNQIEKWLELYSHWFINPVYRLFQSELEAVYEEKNMSMDHLINRTMKRYREEFYKNSPYGQQTGLGSVEHLKNPSLSKMHEYFETYYVARNMALVLAGDFDAESVKPIIEDKFGRWRSGEIPPPMDLKEEPFNGREQVTARLTPVKGGFMGFRTIPRNHEDEMELEVISNLLSNGASTGLLDRLMNENELWMVMQIHQLRAELGGYFIIFVPKIVGQSLGKAEKLITGQLSKLKQGDFSDELLEGVKTELKKQYQSDLEDMFWRTYAIMDAFIYGVPWEKYLEAPEEIEKITREDVVHIANKYFGDNYLVLYSKMGFPKKTKLDKPPYEPIVTKNADKQSEYARMIEQMPVIDMEPRFIDFEQDVTRTELSGGLTTYVTKNPINSIFSIRIRYGKGSYNDPMVSPVTGLFQYAHPEGQPYAEFKSQLQQLGSTMYAYHDLSSMSIEINGLEENLEPTLQLVKRLLDAYTVDEKQLERLTQDIKFNKKLEKNDLEMKNDALGNYALYGRQSEYLSRLPASEMKELTVAELVGKFREITGYEHEVHYCGIRPVQEFNRIYRETMAGSPELIPSPGRIEMERQSYKGNTIIFLDDKKAIQSFINIYVEGAVNDEDSRIRMAGFNHYIGRAWTSILFQEIREFRSLAYYVIGRYNASFFFDRSGYFSGWMSTQSDKTVEALEVFQDILTDMPQKPERIEAVRSGLTLSINADQPMFRDKSVSVSSWLEQGYSQDPRKTRYTAYEKMEFSEILDFYEKNLKGKPWLVTIVGDSKRIDMEQLARFGEIKKVSLEDIFTW